MARPKEVTDEQLIIAARSCFLKRGAGVSAYRVAREVGVFHTTLFNRFGSKEGLMAAALGPSDKVPWVAALESASDERPIREQLIEHGKVISVYFQNLQDGLSVLQAAGILSGVEIFTAHNGQAQPVKAFRARTNWIHQAQNQKRLADCDIETLAHDTP